jgi:two-component system OmpR family response regulator
VLVVDDYRSIANALCRHLRANGHEARAVYSGAAALAEAAAFEPELVLLDIVLPDMTGYDVARELRARAKGPLYIAAISTRKEVADANIDEHAQKPFGLERVIEIVETCKRRTATRS